jgi:hypothetical protein
MPGGRTATAPAAYSRPPHSKVPETMSTSSRKSWVTAASLPAPGSKRRSRVFAPSSWPPAITCSQTPGG